MQKEGWLARVLQPPEIIIITVLHYFIVLWVQTSKTNSDELCQQREIY